MGKALVVIMNKDNAEGLRDCLESLTRQTCEICKCFDVLVVDGGSRDNSEDVARELSRRYPCIRFVTQRFRGGVGPARIEAIKYAKSNDYDVIIWGDSENIYSEDYVEKVLTEVRNNGCEVVSGRPVVICDNMWSKLFFWYHSMHILFSVPSSLLKIRHAPGNNKCSKLTVYDYALYPPISRTDDYYFSYLLMKKDRNGDVKFCHRDDAVVRVKVPSTFKEVLAWQRARVRGLLEGAIVTKSFLPLDNLLWFLYALAPPVALALLVLGYWQLTAAIVAILLAALSCVAYSIYRLGSKIAEINSRAKAVVYGLIGTYLYALLTAYYLIKLMPKVFKLRTELRRRANKVLNHFDFNYELILPYSVSRRVERKGIFNTQQPLSGR